MFPDIKGYNLSYSYQDTAYEQLTENDATLVIYALYLQSSTGITDKSTCVIEDDCLLPINVNPYKCGGTVAETKVVNDRMIVTCVSCGKIRAKSRG